MSTEAATTTTPTSAPTMSLMSNRIHYIQEIYTDYILPHFLQPFFHWTSADNAHPLSLLVRWILTLLSLVCIYTPLVGMLLHSIAFLVRYGWYVLGMTSSTVVLIVSGVLWIGYEWMWHWQSWTLRGIVTGNVSESTSRRRRRPVTIDTSDSSDNNGQEEESAMMDESVQAWAFWLGHILAVLFVWFLYCYLLVQIDYWLFWKHYGSANPHHNAELWIVNTFQSIPVLVGAMIPLQRLWPQMFGGGITVGIGSSGSGGASAEVTAALLSEEA